MKERVFVTKAFLPSKEEYIQLIDKIWDNHILTNMGEMHDEFERELAEYLQMP